MANVNARRVEEILTSGITAGHYVAGSNITITENSDGTETIASTGGGGGGGGFTPTETQLAAMNSGITEAKVTGYDALPDDEDVKDIVSDHFVAGSNITITNNVDGTQTIASTASGGTTDYSDLTNKPSINSVTLSGNKTTSDLGIDEVPDVTSSDDGKILKASYSGSTGTYGWGNLSSTDVTSVLSTAQEFALNSGITSTKVSSYDAINGKMETFYPNLLDVGTNVGEITAQDLDNLSFGIYEYLGMFTGSTLPTELAYKTGVVRGYFTQESMAWNVQFQMVETTDGIFGARVYQGNNTWSNWTFNVPGGGGTAPTAYTAVTYDTTYVNDATSNTHGGYVVNNNICTVNLSLQLTSAAADGSYHKVATGLPKPLHALYPVSVTGDTNPGFFVIGRAGGIEWKRTGTSSDVSIPRHLNISYLVDTST